MNMRYTSYVTFVPALFGRSRYTLGNLLRTSGVELSSNSTPHDVTSPTFLALQNRATCENFP